MVLRQVRVRPCLTVCWFRYVGTLVPVIGLVQAGSQAYADRYPYVPPIGIFLAIAWGILSMVSGRRWRLALAAFAGVSLVALTWTAWVRTGYWRDSGTLVSRTVAITDRDWFVWNNLAVSRERLAR